MFRIRYEYTNPSSAGPFRGGMEVKEKHAKGDYVRAPFGQAIVTSCTKVKTVELTPADAGHPDNVIL